MRRYVLLLLTLLTAGVASAAVLSVSLGTAPAPSSVSVTSTSYNTPTGYQLSGQAVLTSFQGGLYSAWVCGAAITVKDSAQAQLNTRALFNGVAGSLAGTTNNADGSQTRQYLIINPPGLPPTYRCTTQAQVAKVSGAPDIQLDAAAGDQLKLEVNG